MKKSIKSYLRALESGHYDRVLAHFNKNAVVFSPLYGKMPADEFYKLLFSQTQNSNVVLFDLFVNKSRKKATCHFEYQWTLANGQRTTFECVDIFEFGENGKFDQLKIIYDTAGTRDVFTKA